MYRKGPGALRTPANDVGGMPELRRLRSDSRPAAAAAGALNGSRSNTLRRPPEPADMPQDLTTDPITVTHAAIGFHWREWLAFAGCVLGTALFVSVVLAALVLFISTQADAQTIAAPAAIHQDQGAAS